MKLGKHDARIRVYEKYGLSLCCKHGRRPDREPAQMSTCCITHTAYSLILHFNGYAGQ